MAGFFELDVRVANNLALAALGGFVIFSRLWRRGFLALLRFILFIGFLFALERKSCALLFLCGLGDRFKNLFECIVFCNPFFALFAEVLDVRLPINERFKFTMGSDFARLENIVEL